MVDRISRKRLKKKLLDRWENEGGRLVDEETEDQNTSLSSNCTADENDLSSAERHEPSQTK